MDAIVFLARIDQVSTDKGEGNKKKRKLSESVHSHGT